MSQGGDPFGPILEALARDPSTEFGQPDARVEMLGRIDGPFSIVQRVRVQTGGRSITAYAKIHKGYQDGTDEVARIERMLRREYNATSALYQALRQDEEIGAVRPIALLPDHRALVTEEVPGRPFADLLAEASHASDALLGVARRVGAWTRIYQSVGATRGTIALSERRTYLDDRLKLLEGRAISPAGRRAVLARFDALAAGIGAEVAALPIHADLTPGNVIVDANGRISVLDFTMAKVGTAYHDLAHVYFHLGMLGERQGKQEMMRELQRAMLAGYSPALSDGDALFQLMLMQHVVCHMAMVAARRVPVIDLLYRVFLRRRWQTCPRWLVAADDTAGQEAGNHPVSIPDVVTGGCRRARAAPRCSSCARCPSSARPMKCRHTGTRTIRRCATTPHTTAKKVVRTKDAMALFYFGRFQLR